MSGIALGSLFDGSGGFPLAGCMCGIEPVWASEIEPYPIAVTRARLPDMEHLGDVREVSGAEIEPVDVITFGSPCQDMSVAGKRAGMRHEGKGDEDTTRSGLFYEAVRIIREMRAATNGRYPAFAVWENVPGAFSSNRGEDFRCVLEELARIADGSVSVPRPAGRKWLSAGEILGDGFSIAWRVLDAQYWGVPQRRKRIYLVADFAGERAGKILFEREGGSGNPEPGKEARQGAADHAAGGAGRSDRVECLNTWDSQTIRQYGINGVCSTLNSNYTGGQNRQGICYEVAAFMGGQGSKAGGIGYAERIAPTIKSVLSGGNTVPDVVYVLQGNGIDRADTAGCNGAGWRENESYTLNTIDRPAVCYAIDCRNCSLSDELSGTLQAKTNGGYSLNYQNPVVYDGKRLESKRATNDMVAVCVGNGQLHNISMAEQMNTLDCMHDQQAVLTSGKTPRRYIVRRLTPLECCRLQGFPDGWGDIPTKESIQADEVVFWEDVRRTYAAALGKTYRPFRNSASLLKWYNSLHTDSSEYKMWGNGIALPCAAFVLEGIAMELQAQL